MAYQTVGKINTNLLALFSEAEGFSSTGLKPCCGWRDKDGVVRVGTMSSEWRDIENTWAWDLLGQMVGPLLPLIHANNLEIKNAPIVREGGDPVWQIDSGEAFQIDFLKRTIYDYFTSHNRPDGIYEHDIPGHRDGGGAHVSIYSASDGSMVAGYDSPQVPLSQPALPDGSYLVYVQYRGVHEGLRLPADYNRDPQYDYTTQDGRLSHFNPVVFVGEIPADPDHPLNVLRRQLVANNEQQDNQDYQIYVTTEQAVDGRASAIKIQVGGGEWAIAEGVFVTPSRPLHILDFDHPETAPEGASPASLIPLASDPLAHSINYAITTKKDGVWGGKVLLGGSRLSPHSVLPALWEWDEENNNLKVLGTARESCVDYCAIGMTIGMITGLAELGDGSIIVLTMCSRHRYDGYYSLIEDRLPRWPAVNEGEPGGQCIVKLGDGSDGRAFQLAETNTGGVEYLDNAIIGKREALEIRPDRLQYVKGTYAKLDGSLWNHRGKAFGSCVFQENPNLREYICHYNGIWNKGNAAWRPDWLALQRGASVNGISLAFGWVPGSEDAQVIRDDGTNAIVLESDYRVRSGTLTRHQTRGNLQSLIAPAHRVIPAEGSDPQRLDAAWSLVEMDGSHDGAGGELPEENPPDAPEDGRKWRVIELPAHTTIYSVQIRDVMTEKYFLNANADPNETQVGVWLRVDSEADLDDWTSYIWRPQLDREFIFPIPAYAKVQMLVISKPDFAPELLPVMAAV